MIPQKHFILFVDDDPLVLRGFQRSIDEYCENWEAHFASSGKQALSKLAEHPYDAIVTDMHMPVMDGIQLLDAVNRTSPGVIRFVLSGNTSDVQILKSTNLVHQMIPKPCEMEKIYDIVERACRLRDMLSAPQLLRIITGIKTLPSVPRLYNQLLDQLQSEKASSQDVGNIIAQDAAMTAKILQLVNSAFFGVSDNVSSPKKAVTILGLNTIKSLVLGIQVFSEYQGGRNLPVSVDQIWNHSLYVSNIAFSIACSLGLSGQEREDARVSGVLHNIGMLVGFQIPGYFQHVRFNKNGHTLIETEYQCLGTSHAEMGGYLLGIWGLPHSIVEAVTFHHMPGLQAATKPGLLTALHLASGLVNMCQIEKKKDYVSFLDMPCLQRLGLVDRLDEWTGTTLNLLNNTN
jgi:HD-like signal output (HDOD) protein